MIIFYGHCLVTILIWLSAVVFVYKTEFHNERSLNCKVLVHFDSLKFEWKKLCSQNETKVYLKWNVKWSLENNACIWMRFHDFILLKLRLQQQYYLFWNIPCFHICSNVSNGRTFCDYGISIECYNRIY